MSNVHVNLDEANKHTPKGFDLVGNNTYPTKDENGLSTYEERMSLPKAINFVDGTLAAPSTADGDVFVLIGSGVVHTDWGSATFDDWVRFTNSTAVKISPLAGYLCFDVTANEWKEYNGTDWVTFGGGGDNFANADLTLDANREHDLSDFNLKLKNGTTTIEGGTTDNTDDALIVKNPLAEFLKIRNDGQFTMTNPGGLTVSNAIALNGTSFDGDSFITYNNANEGYLLNGSGAWNNYGFIGGVRLTTTSNALNHGVGMYLTSNTSNNTAVGNMGTSMSSAFSGLDSSFLVYNSGTNSKGINLVSRGSNAAIKLRSTTTTTGAAPISLLINNVGNVGINETTPTAKLHVAGDTQIDGELTINAASSGTIGHVWTSTGVNGEGNWAAATVPVGSGGIYSGSGSLSGATTVNTESNTLSIVAENGVQTANALEIVTGGNTSPFDAFLIKKPNNFALLDVDGDSIGIMTPAVAEESLTVNSYGGSLQSTAMSIRNTSSSVLFRAVNGGKIAIGESIDTILNSATVTSAAVLNVGGIDNLGTSKALLVRNLSGSDLLDIRNDGSTTIGGDTQIDGDYSQNGANTLSTYTATSSTGLNNIDFNNDDGNKGQILSGGSAFSGGTGLQLLEDAFAIRSSLNAQRFALGARNGDFYFCNGSNLNDATTSMKVSSSGVNIGGGIGADAITHRLMVQGTQLFNGNMTLNGNQDQSAANPLNTITATSAAGLGEIDFNNDGGNIAQILTGGSSFVGGTGLPLLTDSFVIRSNTGAQRFVLGARNGDIYFTVGSNLSDANTNMKVTTSGALIGSGIGASSAGADLHVIGTIRSDQTVQAGKSISADFLPINVNGTVRYIALYD